MALSTYCSPSSPYSFPEDDEETWKLLASSPGASDIGQRLTSLAQRWEEDHPSNAQFWDDMLEQLQGYGFRYSTGDIQKLPKSGPDSVGNPPAAFESEVGKLHVAAVASLLGKISDDRAIQVTLNALRSIESDGSQFQSLLGSRDLLWKTLRYHQQQRLARLGVLTECLRLEQDPEVPTHTNVLNFLDSLDNIYKDEDRYRGLFRRLLTIACAPTITPSREQLEPVKLLHSDQSRFISGTSSPEREWNAFCATIVDELRMQQMRERREALEALLVLLYSRINQGVRRADYAIMLLACKSTHNFFTEAPGPHDLSGRLVYLASLIFAECTALWRTFDSTSNSNWASQHPLLLEISTGGHLQGAQKEIHSLTDLLSNLVDDSLSRNVDGAPEAIAMLSFGLLLRLAHTSLQPSSPEADSQTQTIWSSFTTVGTEMVQRANEQCNAFDYLLAVLNNLTNTSTSKRSAPGYDMLYDWQFSDNEHTLLLENGGSRISAAPDTTAYTSIAREVLAASIAAFEDSVLAIDQSNSCENIGILCSIGAKVFQNNDLLCDQFWADWEIYSSGSTNGFPLCKLLDNSHRMTVAALQAFLDSNISRELFVQAVAPFFQLLSTLCHTSDLVEATISTFPERLLRQVLLCCQIPLSSTGTLNKEYQSSRFVLLTAISHLAKFGNSNSCLMQLRRSLEEPSQEFTDGPRVLSRLLIHTDNPQNALEPVLAIMAHLLDAAPQQWAVQLAREIMESGDTLNFSLSRCLSPGEVTIHSASLVLAELIEHLTSVVFSDAINENDSIAYLHCITSSLLSAAAALASSLSVQGTPPSSKMNFSFETAQTIMQCIGNFLKWIRPVVKLHESQRVRASGIEMRDIVVDSLASSTGIGQSIIYYATAPVSLTLTINLQLAIEDRSILQQMMDGAQIDGTNPKKYGAWQAFMSQQQRDPIQYLAQHFLVESVGKLTCDDIDLEGIMVRNWSNVPDMKAPLNTSFVAIGLLSQWASHIDDMLTTHLDDQQLEIWPLNYNAKLLIEAKSPYRLLSSLAMKPIPCRKSNTMESCWDAAGLSNFELLLPFLARPLSNGSNADLFESFPSSPLLDLVHACLCHVRSISDKDAVADSLLFRALYRSPRFGQLLLHSIDDALDISEQSGDPGRKEKAQLLDGILSLQVLAFCVGCNATIADAMLHAKDDSMITKLITVACEIKIPSSSSEDLLFHKERDIVKLRLATGCLSVLASLWQCIRAPSLNSNSSSATRLINEINMQRTFITELVSAVLTFSLSKNLASSVANEYARGTLVNYVALALQILATEAAHKSNETTNSLLQSFLLRDLERSEKFVGFQGYSMVAAIFSELQHSGFSNTEHAMKVIQCFPATSAVHLTPNSISVGNSFDVSAALFWLSHSSDIEEECMKDLVMNLSASHQLLYAEVQIMKGWKRFSETVFLHASHLQQGLSRTDRVFDFANDTLLTLITTLETMNKVQIESGHLMLPESKRMLHYLADSTLFFLDMGARHSDNRPQLSIDYLLGTLGKLANISELLQAVSFQTDSVDSELISDSSCLALETTIMASTIVVLGLIDSSEMTPNVDQTSRRHQAYQKICRANCNTLQVTSRRFQSTPRAMELYGSFLYSVSLFTSLFSRKSSRNVDDSIFLKTISDIMSEFHLAEGIIDQAIHSANEANKSMSDEAQVDVSREHLILVQCVLDFLCAIAEAGSVELLATLPKPKLAQLLVRNPLFLILSKSESDSMPRGYLLSRSNTSDEMGNFKIGEDDPFHKIWVTSIKVLTAATHLSHDHGDRAIFIDMCLEFLQVYHFELILTMKSCGSRLTTNGLHEITCILGMIAELCKRNIRDQFRTTHKDLCLEFVTWSTFIVATLSKFLGAAGTSRELFFCTEKMHSESENFPVGVLSASQRWHPLLEEGIPSAKHEAVKFSHYASKCCQRVTTSDFRASSVTSEVLSKLARAHDDDSDLERTSRLSVTNDFTTKMERCAAACLEQAVVVLWRMHPSSFSFHRVSEAEIGQIDVMAMVQIGAIIGFRPFESGYRSETVDIGESGFKALSFGRVVAIDTIKRSWVVRPVHRLDVDEFTWIVRAGQLAGFEELVCRKTIASYQAAPNHLFELENISNKLCLGHLILVLRWCHQETFVCGKQCGNGDFLVQRLAEQITALLGAEISIHDEIYSREGVPAKVQLKVDAQLLELFADPKVLESSDNVRYPVCDGRMKSLIEKSAWEVIRSQVSAGIVRSLKAKQEKEQKRTEKRSLSKDALWYTGLHRSGVSQKSAFRGFR